MDLILMIIFCYLLFRAAKTKGISPVSYILNYIVMVIMVIFLLVYGLVTFYGPEVLNTEKGVKIALVVEMIALGFEVLLYFILKKKIEQIEFYDEDENESSHTTPNQKKDLSYFR